MGNFKITDEILDLGGGAGRIAKFFVGKVSEITVVDALPNMISQCQKQKGVSCIVADAENLALSENYFDKIIIIDAFHHFSNQQKTTKQIRRVLKPGGKIIMEEFNPEKFFGWLASKIEKTFDPKGNMLAPMALADLFNKHGFKIELINGKQLIYYLVGEKI